MESLLLQDWVTIRGASAVTVLTQPETDWLDVGAYQDLVVWTEVKEFTPASGLWIPSLHYQTSPSKDDSLFFNMGTQTQVLLGVTTTVILKVANAGFPPCARWMRWQVTMTGSLAWDVTFRIWVAANRVGNRVGLSEAATLAELEGEGNDYAYGQCSPTAQSPSQGGGGSHYSPPQVGGGVGTPPPWWGTGGKPPGLPGVPGSSGGSLPMTHTGQGPLGHDPSGAVKTQK